MDEKAIYYLSNNSEVWAKDVRSKTAIWKRGNQTMQKVMEFCEVGLVTATLLTFKIYYSHQQGESSTELCGEWRHTRTSRELVIKEHPLWMSLPKNQLSSLLRLNSTG